MTTARLILILAAGASSRMRGTDKLLEEIDGQPQIRRITKAALATGAAVFVTLPTDRPARVAALSDLAVHRIAVPGAAEGMATSIREGLCALPPDRPLLLLLADLPEITEDELRRMLTEQAATPQAIVRATSFDGRPGHPVGFPAALRPALAALQGDAGARALLAENRDLIRLIALPEQHATTDLDTPEDWAAWRAAHASG
ncbi:MAG: NTP transferase domain-containing protein [Paracoccaceae bacterium]|nr:NTP transferase domain-containing protein [Paracoccaceae bacterium]